MAMWQAARVPSGFDELWCVELGSAGGAGPTPPPAAVGDHRQPHRRPPRARALGRTAGAVADELTSNALRHGGGPVATALSRIDDQWLVSVSDRSPDVPPVPAQGRDPRHGGLGLYLIADLAVRHGWFADRGVKTVWAVVAAD